MSWWTGAALGFDLETDGKDPQDARIITAATVLVTPGNAPQAIETMLQPERDIPAEATGVHGITTERAREEGALRQVGIARTATTIAELAGPEVPLVGHNVTYDLTVLDREMRRVGIGCIGTDRETGLVWLEIAGSQVARFPVIDTLVLDKAVDRYRKGKRQLSHVAEFYGVPMEEGAAHGATADVIASLRIAIRIANRAKVATVDAALLAERHYGDRRKPMEIGATLASVGRLSLTELHAAQAGWAAEQARGLRQYFIENPGPDRDPAGVSEEWPIRTLNAVEDVSTELI